MTSTPLRGARHRPDDAGPAPFTPHDFAARMARAAASAEQAGLDGVLVTPGPDLLYLSGYAPVAITERITMLVVAPDREPTMIVPVLERPDAEAAPSASRLQLVDWRDGTNPYEAAAALLDPRGRYAISDSAWSMHLLGLIEQLPESRYVSMTEALPMLRAVKDADELQRLSSAAEAADAAYYDILEVPFAGRKETEIGADLADLLRKYGHSQVDFTVVGSGPNGANPHHEVGERVIATATWSCWTSAASGTATARTRPGPCTSANPPPKSARCTTSSAKPNRRASRRCARAYRARRSTGFPVR